jgi:serine phosphatase RsbU (regulator of sigma subunit)
VSIVISQARLEKVIIENLNDALDKGRYVIDTHSAHARYFSYSWNLTMREALRGRDLTLDDIRSYFNNLLSIGTLGPLMGYNEGEIKTVEVTFGTNIVIQNALEFHHTRYYLTQDEIDFMWNFLSRPEFHPYFRMSFPFLMSNIVIMRSTAFLSGIESDRDDNTPQSIGVPRNIGLIVSGFPLDYEFLSVCVSPAPGVIYIIETTNGIIFSDYEFNKEIPNELIGKIELTDGKPYTIVNVPEKGRYYFTRRELFSITKTTESGERVRYKIADIGVLYSAEVMEEQLREYIRIVVIIFGIVVVILVFLAFFSAEKITRPVLDLQNKISFFEQHLEPVLNPEYINDELDELHQTFSHMTLSICSEFEQAAIVQKSILTNTAELRNIKNLDFDIRYLPMNGQISGDYYNIYQHKNGTVSIIITDASGHGTQAALTTMQIDILNRLSSRISYPHERFRFLGHEIDKLGTKNFFTGFIADINIKEKVLSYSSAAHPPQFLLKPSTKQIIPLKTPGKIIGMVEIYDHESRVEKLDSGDILFLFTDGLTEEINSKQEEFGEEGIIKFLKTLLHRKDLNQIELYEISDNLLNTLMEFRDGLFISDNNVISDDITIIMVRIK